MFGNILRDKIRNTEIQQTKVQDVEVRVIDIKWTWACKMVRLGDGRWNPGRAIAR